MSRTFLFVLSLSVGIYCMYLQKKIIKMIYDGKCIKIDRGFLSCNSKSSQGRVFFVFRGNAVVTGLSVARWPAPH